MEPQRADNNNWIWSCQLRHLAAAAKKCQKSIKRPAGQFIALF